MISEISAATSQSNRSSLRLRGCTDSQSPDSKLHKPKCVSWESWQRKQVFPKFCRLCQLPIAIFFAKRASVLGQETNWNQLLFICRVQGVVVEDNPTKAADSHQKSVKNARFQRVLHFWRPNWWMSPGFENYNREKQLTCWAMHEDNRCFQNSAAFVSCQLPLFC